MVLDVVTLEGSIQHSFLWFFVETIVKVLSSNEKGFKYETFSSKSVSVHMLKNSTLHSYTYLKSVLLRLLEFNSWM